MPAQRDRERRVLLLSATTAYQTGDFVAAAQKLGVAVTIGSDRCHVLAETWPEGALALEFRDWDRAAAQIAEAAASTPFCGVVATDEVTSRIAARAAQRLGLAHNSPAAADLAGDKLAFRRAMTRAGLPQPGFSEVPLPADELPSVSFPVVVKPLRLSASRGVMRADDSAELRQRLDRLFALLSAPEIQSNRAIVEEFVAGDEVAFEGLLSNGRLSELAVFDKPEPLDGPFFAETIYVTPPRRPASQLRAIASAVDAAARAIGLVEGPVHAELRVPPPGKPWAAPVIGGGDPRTPRVPPSGVVVLELAARSIGGLCGRALSFGAGISLEEVIVSHAVGDPVSVTRDGGASGVLMLPVPELGVLDRIDGLDAARAVPGIQNVVITARSGELVVPLPEGHTYLGFAFAIGDRAEDVVAALTAARDELRVEIRPRIGPTS